MTSNGLMTVGELSRRTDVPIKALREYADWGLIYTVGAAPPTIGYSTPMRCGAYAGSAPCEGWG